MTLIYLSFFLFLFNLLTLNRFKNGQPYPWSSSLILYPQAENQTIYTRHATINDNANYTCVIRNDTHKTEHVIEFTVQGMCIIIVIVIIKNQHGKALQPLNQHTHTHTHHVLQDNKHIKFHNKNK